MMLILSIALLLLPTQLFAGQQPIVGMMGMWGAGGTTVECSAATDFIGLKTTPGASASMTGNRPYAALFTATCPSGCSSGTLTTPYLYHSNTTNANQKICIYSDDGDSTPDSGDTLIDCSDGLTTTTSGYVAGTGISGSVTCGTNYWVVLIVGSLGWSGGYDASGTTYYQSISGSYDAPPSDLSGTWTTLAGRTYGGYVTID